MTQSPSRGTRSHVPPVIAANVDVVLSEEAVVDTGKGKGRGRRSRVSGTTGHRDVGLRASPVLGLAGTGSTSLAAGHTPTNAIVSTVAIPAAVANNVGVANAVACGSLLRRRRAAMGGVEAN